MIDLGSLAWQRPLALAGLCLPLLLLLLSLRPERPVPVPTGTFALWRGLGERGTGAYTSRRIPPARWLLALALALASLALAEPRQRVEDVEPRWRVVVDRSPSMYLAHGAGTRLDAALERLAQWRREAGLQDAELEWLAPAPWVDGGGDARRARALPGAWSRPPERARPAPRWELFDRAGTLLLTDRAPEPAPREAGVAAGGGPEVRGPIASGAGALLAWDAGGWSDAPLSAAPALVVRGALPEPIERIARVWAADRGLAVGADGDAALVIEGPPPGAAGADWQRADAGGWSLRARPRLEPDRARGPLDPWLAARGADGARTWVAWRVGLVAVDLVECEEPAGDPAAFAVAWSRLLDDAVAPAPGVISAAERADAGSGVLTPPSTPPAASAGPASIPLVTVLAAAAALAALLAALVSGPGKRL